MATPALQSFRIDRDDGLPLTFEGVLLAKVISSPDRAHSDFSGLTGRWQRLEIYRTAKGAFVCVRYNVTQWQGERDETFAEVVFEPAGIAAFFGHGVLARELYQRAGFDFAEHVE